ncbi:MAG: Hpt domain-containing protein [Saprospiraceae bacterium]|jgi:HPt (histidine-containing phosphotransfer) domain-containing protein
MKQTDFQYINLEYLETVTDGDPEMKKEILGLVIDEIRNDMPRLSVLHASGDWDTLHNITHKFKSTLAFVGNELLTDTNREVEQISKVREKTESVPQLLQVINELQPRVEYELDLAYNSL